MGPQIGGQLLLTAEADLALRMFLVGNGGILLQLQALPTFLTQLHLPIKFLLESGAAQSSVTARVSAAVHRLLEISVSGV